MFTLRKAYVNIRHIHDYIFFSGWYTCMAVAIPNMFCRLHFWYHIISTYAYIYIYIYSISIFKLRWLNWAIHFFHNSFYSPQIDTQTIWNLRRIACCFHIPWGAIFLMVLLFRETVPTSILNYFQRILSDSKSSLVFGPLLSILAGLNNVGGVMVPT